MDGAAALIGGGIVVARLLGAVAASRWERRYSREHPRRRRPEAARSGRVIPLLISLAVCGVGVRVMLTGVSMPLRQHLGISGGFILLLIAVAVSFQRWMRDRPKTDATRRVANRVLICIAVLAVLAFGFAGVSS